VKPAKTGTPWRKILLAELIVLAGLLILFGIIYSAVNPSNDLLFALYAALANPSNGLWFAVYAAFAIWVLEDCSRRRTSSLGWTLGTFFLGPIVLPIYFAKRPLKTGEVREGGTAWNILRNFALLWTVAMAAIGVGTLIAVSTNTATLQSDAERSGAAIGTALALGVIGALWFFPTLGSVLLGFLLKKSSVVEKGPTGPLSVEGTPLGTIHSAAWVGIVALSLIGLGALARLGRDTWPNPQAEKRTQQTETNSVAEEENKAQQPVFNWIDGDTTYHGAMASNVGVAVIGIKSGPFLIGNPWNPATAWGVGGVRANGKFIIVTVGIYNRQSSAVTMDSGLFKILDSNGNEYSASQERMEVGSGSNLFLAQINPGMTNTGEIVFDVPENLSLDNLKLRFRGGMTGDSADLALKVNSTVKQVPPPPEETSPYRNAAEQGDADAQSNLGFMFEKGRGVTQDYAQAVYWYRKAAEQGNAVAQNNLGFLYYKGLGVTQDYPQAVSWFRKAAEQGNARAQDNLGFSYWKGLGVPQDYAQAVYWCRKAAEQGYAHAQSGLGVMFEKGRGVPQDYAQAVYWYRKAAEQGDAEAQVRLGNLYSSGYGLPQDYAQAYFWLGLAASGKVEGVKQEDVDKLRGDAASHLTPAELSQVQERVRKWLEQHPPKVE
jgi:hypothetical protein